MKSFVRERGADLGTVVLVMIAISLNQAGISLTMTLGGFGNFLPKSVSWLVTALLATRFVLVALMIMLWASKRKSLLSRTIILANVLFTAALLGHTEALIATLFGFASQAIGALLVNVVLMLVSNILVFSIWYWVIDPPGVENISYADRRWDFLFPQRAGSVPHYESWVPRYLDYLYIAFTTSFAFSPTDTLPLTRRAKMLMLLQSIIAVVTLTGIAGGAINILAGSK